MKVARQRDYTAGLWNVISLMANLILISDTFQKVSLVMCNSCSCYFFINKFHKAGEYSILLVMREFWSA